MRDFVARFSGPRVSLGSVKRTLDDAGIEPHPTPKPRRKPKKKAPRRFERAKAGQLCQSDITSFHLPRDSRRVYLTVFLDDHSRFIVAWTMACHQKSELVTEALFEGLGCFGRPDEILTDQGRPLRAVQAHAELGSLLKGDQALPASSPPAERHSPIRVRWLRVGVRSCRSVCRRSLAQG